MTTPDHVPPQAGSTTNSVSAVQCSTCIFFNRKGVDLRANAVGQCLWMPPPFMRRLIDMLGADPATRFNYPVACEEPPDTFANGWCSEHKLNQ